MAKTVDTQVLIQAIRILIAYKDSLGDDIRSYERSTGVDIEVVINQLSASLSKEEKRAIYEGLR